MHRNAFPPPVLSDTLSVKLTGLRRDRFGYQLLPFEHDKDENGDVGLRAMPSQGNLLQTTFDLLPAGMTGPRQPFSRLADRLNEFFEQTKDRRRKSFSQIVFCRACRQLHLICMKEEQRCSECGSDLVMQS